MSGCGADKGGEALRIQKGQQWKHTKTLCGEASGKVVTIDDEGCTGPCCGKYKDDCMCICAPSICLCHTLSPCYFDEKKGERCYYGWVGSSGLGFVVFDGGQKMRTEIFCTCDEFEKVIAATRKIRPSCPGQPHPICADDIRSTSLCARDCRWRFRSQASLKPLRLRPLMPVPPTPRRCPAEQAASERRREQDAADKDDQEEEE